MSRILIADDDPDIRELCFTILSTEGFEVLVAENAPECLLMARKDQPDLILLDWMMPGVDGMEALQLLKSSAATVEIPVVMVTAFGGPMEITLATHHGAEGYVTKPFEVADLLSLVRRFTAPPPPLPTVALPVEADLAGPSAGLA
ncbi:MAG: response regulator receiver modulated diguanylate cyclase [Armatimonadetes bacterium]|jgi:DNA-binding response OmpR family regulator|nr:response regulator receiver modulated diguanylate cyclase [Armatimonadota bacterium]